MNRTSLSRALLTLVTTAIPAVAQIEYLQTDWPTAPAFAGGSFEELVVGRFHHRDLGRSAVIRRGSALFVAYQPAHFDHVAATGETGVTAIAVVPRVGLRDRLAIADASGLQLATFDGSAFQRLATPTAAFANASRLATRRAEILGVSGVAVAALVGSSSVALGWVADGSDAVLHSATVTLTRSTVHDLCCVQYDADPAPEVAIAHSTGLTIHDTDGSLLANFPAPLTAGRVAAWSPAPGTPGPEAIAAVGTIGGVTALYLTAGTSLTVVGAFPAPIVALGLASGDVDGDGDQEVVVSTAAAESHVLGYLGASLLPSGAEVVPHHTAGMTPGPGPATAAPALVDVDRDGALDLVTADAATDSLITILGLDAVIRILALLPPAQVPPKIAFISAALLWEPATPSVALSGDVIVGVDLSEVPPTFDHLHIVAYVHGDPTLTEDGVALTRRSERLFARGGASGEAFLAARIDSHAPVGSYSMPYWPGAQHYWIEVRPVQLDPTTGEMLEGGKSILYALTVRPSETAEDYATFLDGFGGQEPADVIDAVSKNFDAATGDEIADRHGIIDRRQVGVGRTPLNRPPVITFTDDTEEGSPGPIPTVKTASG